MSNIYIYIYIVSATIVMLLYHLYDRRIVIPYYNMKQNYKLWLRPQQQSD